MNGARFRDGIPRGARVLLLLALVLAGAAVVWLLVRRGEPAEEAGPVEPAEERLPMPGAGVEAPEPGPPPPLGARARGVRAFEEQIDARLAADQPRTAPLEQPLRVRLLDVLQRDLADAPLFRAEAVVASVDAAALAGGGLLVSDLRLDSPELFLERAPGAELWNYEPILERYGVGDDGAEVGPEGDGAPFIIREALIDNGFARVRDGEAGEYTFRDLDATIPRAELAGPGVALPEVEVARLTTRLRSDPEGVERDIAVDDALLRFPDAVVAFDVERARIGESVFTDAAGVFDPAGAGLGFDAVVRGEEVRFADIAFLLPDGIPEEGVASFDLRAEPAPGDRTIIRITGLTATSGESAIAGRITVLIGGPAAPRFESFDLELDDFAIALLEPFTGPLPYDGRLEGTVSGGPDIVDFDLLAELTAPDVTEPFTAVLEGRAEFEPDDFALRRLDADLTDVPVAVLRPLAPGLPLEGLLTGRVSLRGPPDEVPLVVDARLNTADGLLSVAGTIDLTGATPAYDLTGMIAGIDLEQLFEPEVPPVSVTGAFAVAGSGTDPLTAAANIRFAGAFTGWTAEPGDSIVIAAAVREGSVDVADLRVDLGPLSLRADGRWRYETPATGGIDYVLSIRSLEPFAPYLPFLPEARLAGGIETTGRLSGSFEVPRIVGELAGEALRYGDWTAERARAEYDIAFTRPVATAAIAASARQLGTPAGNLYETATARGDLDRMRFAVDIEADRVGGDAARADLAGRFLDPEAEQALLERLRLRLDGQDWALVSPTLIDRSPPDGVIVRDLRMHQIDGEGRIVASGWLPPTEGQRLRVELARVPSGEILGIVQPQPVVTGDLWVDAVVTGPADDPVIDGTFRLEGGTIRDVVFAHVEGDIDYRDQRLVAAGTAVVDTLQPGSELSFDAALPLALDLGAPGQTRILDAGPLRATVVADQFPVRAIGEFTPRITDAEGLISGRVVTTGSPGNPSLDGMVTLQDGAVTVPELDQRYEQITGVARLEDEVVTIESLQARSDGWAEATGTIRFERIDRPMADLQVTFTEFRAVGVPGEDDAAVWGELAVTGPLASPVVSGRLRVDDGAVPAPQVGGNGEFDEEFVDIAAEPVRFEDLDADTVTAEDAGIEPTGPLGPLVLERVVVEFDDDAWVATEQGRVQLSGELELAGSDGDLRVTGTLEGTRGQFVLRAGPLVRRLDIVDAEVRFLGSTEIDPVLDITASRIVFGSAGEEIEILIRVQGTASEPAVAFSTGAGAPIPESELLGFLLFGEPTFALEEGAVPGEPLFVGGLADILSLELEQLLLQDLGLPVDVFEIRPGPTLGAPILVFGTEVTDDVFLRVETGLGGAFGLEGAPAGGWAVLLTWRIDPEWRLELGLEPVSRAFLFRGLRPIVPALGTDQQFIIELRRRWTY